MVTNLNFFHRYGECTDVTDVSTSPLVPKSLGGSTNLNHVQSMQQMNGHLSSPLRHVKREELSLRQKIKHKCTFISRKSN